MNTIKKMGFWSIVLLTINSIIGTGIFLSPGSVAKIAGSWAPVIYLCAGIFAAILAISFASASKYVNKSGAAYAYAKTAFGDNVGLYVGITRFVAASIAWGVMATAVVKTVLNIFKLDQSNLVFITIGFLALMAILLIVNLFGTKVLTRISDLSTIGKLAALIIFVVAGVVVLIVTGANNFAQINTVTNASGETLASTMNTQVFVAALISAFYAYTGFESVASGASDMESPEKNLPRAIPIGIALVAAVYCSIVLVSMMLNPVALVTSTEVVVLASVFNNPIVSALVVLGALISMFGINVAASFHTPRILEAMAQENQFPSFFAKREKNGFPLRAFLLTAIIAIVVPMAFQYNMGSIMVISSISRFVQFIIVPCAVIFFFFGMSKEKTLDAKKNGLTDVVIPLVSLGLTVLLLTQFDWVGNFSIATESGQTANYFAIAAMVVGYVVLPLLAFIYKKVSK
ncbi:MAG: APC family permease [Anaerorhabdus sp.]